MPIGTSDINIDNQQLLEDAALFAHNPGAIRTQKDLVTPEPEPGAESQESGFLETVGADIEENTAVAAYFAREFENQDPYDPNFDFAEHIPKEYEHQFGEFADASSIREIEQIKADLDRSRENQERL